MPISGEMIEIQCEKCTKTFKTDSGLQKTMPIALCSMCLAKKCVPIALCSMCLAKKCVPLPED